MKDGLGGCAIGEDERLRGALTAGNEESRFTSAWMKVGPDLRTLGGTAAASGSGEEEGKSSFEGEGGRSSRSGEGRRDVDAHGC